MISKSDNPNELLAGKKVAPVVEAWFDLCHLKQLYRRGWLARGVPARSCESVAEHTFGVALLALLLMKEAREDLDAARVLRMALVHDVGEVHAGDTIPRDGVDAAEKIRREREGARRVLGRLDCGPELLALRDEYDEGRTAEARFVRQLDRLEMGMQAGVYEMQGHAGLDEFFETVGRTLSEPALEEVFRAVESLRTEGDAGDP